MCELFEWVGNGFKWCCKVVGRECIEIVGVWTRKIAGHCILVRRCCTISFLSALQLAVCSTCFLACFCPSGILQHCRRPDLLRTIAIRLHQGTSRRLLCRSSSSLRILAPLLVLPRTASLRCIWESCRRGCGTCSDLRSVDSANGADLGFL